MKLMGRDSGFVAMHGATAADVVDLCMIPEVKVEMKDAGSVFSWAMDLVNQFFLMGYKPVN